MKCNTARVALGLISIGMLCWVEPSLALDPPVCDIPLVVQSNGSAPNILVVLDNSSSMREALYHENYDPSQTYTGEFTSDRTYYVSANGNYTPNDFYWQWATTPTAPLVQSGTMTGRYVGNYMNWIFYHATDTERLSLPQVTRIEVGKAAIASVAAQIPDFRYGLMVFNDDDGGNLVVPVGSELTDFFVTMAGIQADEWTPTAETLVDATEYFKKSTGDVPIQTECQFSFIVLVTDGYPTQDLNMPSWMGDLDGDGNEPGDCTSIGSPSSNSSDCSDYMDDVAHYLANTDLRPDLEGDQVVYTYTIGFGIDAPLLQDTADNGEGLYLTAWDLATLQTSLSSVLSDIVARVAANSAVSLVSGADETSSDYLYRAAFTPQAWRGFLEAYTLPYTPGQPREWEAGSLLESRVYSSRTVYTWDDGGSIDFTASNADLLMDELGYTDEDDAEDLIEWVLGRSFPQFRDRAGWKLGDIVSSTPRAVGPPANFYIDQDYQTFLQTHANRTPMLYVGANDGMLHAFDASTGNEEWAYVPEGVLPNLSELARKDYCHRSYVDQTAQAYDVYIGGAWRTVLICGLGGGGDTYFAIDVTNPTQPIFLWETSIPAIRTSFSRAVLVNTVGGTYLWTGSGPGLGTAPVAMLDLATGNLVTSSQLGGSIIGNNMSSMAAPLDKDWDGFVDYVYQTDLAGSLWRWDVRTGTPTDWSPVQVYSGSQPIQAAPSVALSAEGDAWIFFGTGRFLDIGDVFDSSLQSFVGILDDGSQQGLTKSSLTNQTNSIQDPSLGPGWYFDLTQQSAERVIQPAVLVNGVVYFSSFAPEQGLCANGGRSWLYSVNYLNGATADEDPEATPTSSGRASELDEGIASEAAVDLGAGQIIIQTSQALISARDLVAPPDQITVSGWRQTFK